ncbi:MAG: hypothetical protein IKI49_03790 [Oscillospiraceae bacterium]|nr:hypothetical protein [Oscillospiraceae bacterium]
MHSNADIWHNMNNFDDVSDFMNSVDNFHDSCIKELIYVSGSYVLPDLSMHALNDMRKLRVIIQRQFATMTTIEIEFSGLIKLILQPADPTRFTSELLGIYMQYSEEGFVFSDIDLSKTDIKNNGIYICALSARWRGIDTSPKNDSSL